jgi:hypothetical protein
MDVRPQLCLGCRCKQNFTQQRTNEPIVQQQPQLQSSQSADAVQTAACPRVTHWPNVLPCSTHGTGSPEGPLGPAGVLAPYTAGWNPVHKPMIVLTNKRVCRQCKVNTEMPACGLRNVMCSWAAHPGCWPLKGGWGCRPCCQGRCQDLLGCNLRGQQKGAWHTVEPSMNGSPMGEYHDTWQTRPPEPCKCSVPLHGFTGQQHITHRQECRLDCTLGTPPMAG